MSPSLPFCTPVCSLYLLNTPLYPPKLHIPPCIPLYTPLPLCTLSIPFFPSTPPVQPLNASLGTPPWPSTLPPHLSVPLYDPPHSSVLLHALYAPSAPHLYPTCPLYNPLYTLHAPLYSLCVPFYTPLCPSASLPCPIQVSDWLMVPATGNQIIGI